MSNARIRSFLETQSAPVVALLIEGGWVVDDCGMLNARYGNIREGVLVVSRQLQNMVPVPVPDKRLRERL